MMRTDKCFITGLDTIDVPGEIDIFEYKISISGKSRLLRFEVNEWREIIVGETKSILNSLLINDQWPLDEETIISQQLVQNILRMGPQPKVFKEKTNYFLENLYKRGADELKWVEVDIAKFHVAYAKNEDEYSRIIEALVGEGLIEFAVQFTPIKNHNQKVRLTNIGIKKVELSDSVKSKLEYLIKETPKKPSIFLLYVERDKVVASRFSNLFSQAGFIVHSNGDGVPDKSSSYPFNVRQTIYDEINYFLIIKSRISDMNNSYGSVIDIAIESHLLTKSDKKFIFIATIDDSPYDSRPRLIDYHQQSYEGRLHNIRERLLFDILSDWRNRLAHSEENKIQINTKLDLLRWLILQIKIYQKNPVKFDLRYLKANLKDTDINTDEKLTAYLSELKADKVLSFDIFKSPTIETHFDYHATILDIAPSWLDEQQKSNINTSKQDIYQEENDEGEILNIQRIHDELFLFLKQWGDNARTSSPSPLNPFFYMRRVRDSRFKKGYWFPGNESYLCISFWSGNDSYNKTPNIYFEVHAKYGIRVLMTAKDSEIKSEYLERMSDRLNSQMGKSNYAANGTNKFWVKIYSANYRDYMKYLREFMDNDKILIDNFLNETPPPEFEEFVSELNLIDSKDFDIMISRVFKERELIYPKSTNTDKYAELVLGIISISVENYQGISETEVTDLPLNCPWIFLTGENGFGKTSFLQAIALGLDANPDLEKFIEEKTRIQLGVGFRFFKDYLVRTKGNLAKENSIKYSDFIIGYGPSRLLIQAKTSQNAEDKSENSVLSLFDYQALLKNINFEFITTSKSDPKLYSKLEELIRSVTGGRISEIKVINREVLFVEKLKNGDEMKPQPLEKLAAGFKVVLNVAFDIFIRFQKIHQTLDYVEFFGIVFIDELENHLHPSFQKELPRLLSSVFPKIQFIATTHSPIPLLGAPINSVFLKVERSLEHGIQCRRLDINIEQLLPNAVFTSPLFDMENISNSNIDNLSDVNTIDYFSDVEKQNMIRENIKRFENGDQTFPDELFT